MVALVSTSFCSKIVPLNHQIERGLMRFKSSCKSMINFTTVLRIFSLSFRFVSFSLVCFFLFSFSHEVL